jgi:uncharacterized protein with HEPN domain
MRTDESCLLDMRHAAKRIVRYLDGVSREKFELELEKRDAVALRLIRLGEAATGISDEFRRRHPEVPWSKVIGVRNRILHDLFDMNWDMVWAAATHDVPELIRLLDPLIPPEDSV